MRTIRPSAVEISVIFETRPAGLLRGLHIYVGYNCYYISITADVIKNEFLLCFVFLKTLTKIPYFVFTSLPTFADTGCHVVSVTDPYGRILGFIDRSLYFYIKYLFSCTH
jgi:hypothetical protein